MPVSTPGTPWRAVLATPLATLSLVGAAVAPAQAAEVVVPFAFTGAEQQFVVPAGVQAVRVVAVGGHGGRGWTVVSGERFVSAGGAGARVEATVPVSPGQRLVVTVAANGQEGFQTYASAFGGGGKPALYSGDATGGGGGASDVRTCAAALCALTGGAGDPRLVVAGGGGGGGTNASVVPGAGGDAGLVAQPGGAGQASGPAGGGQGGGAGTDSSPGAAGAAGIGTQTLAGAPGGVGTGGATQIADFSTRPGGAGGGGWFGGGSGGNGAWSGGQVGAGGGGGAGSSHVAAGASDAQINVDATGTPSVTISYTPDTTAPQISIAAPVDGAGYTAGQSVTADYACADGAGVTRCDGDVPSGSALDTASPGEHTFTVTATDAAGNTRSRTVRYTVAAVPAAMPPTAPPVVLADPARAPVLALAARRRSLNTIVSSRGFLIAARCDVRCDASVTATLRGRTVGSGSSVIAAAGKAVLLRVKLTKAAVQALRGRRSATFLVTVRATAGGRTTTKTLRITARRQASLMRVIRPERSNGSLLPRPLASGVHSGTTQVHDLA